MSRKRSYLFGGGRAEGHGMMKDALGGKGSGLAEMTNAGAPVPPGFTITTEVCCEFLRGSRKVGRELEPDMKRGIRHIERLTGKKFGDRRNPLLVSVRSGAKYSMPGMMDTVLNLGLNDKTVEGLAEKTGDPRFALDCYRRFMQMFGNVVLGVDSDRFEEVLNEVKLQRGRQADTELTADDLREVISGYKELVKRVSGKQFPQDPWRQLSMSRDAVFLSWNNPRAKHYRAINHLPDELGTAINVQAMVFGNMGVDSATGVGFTRDPGSGEKTFYGEYLINAQGEDVVAGIRTPRPIEELQGEMPEVYSQLTSITHGLEKHYRDIQDFEFTVEQGQLYMLQTRSGKRTGQAALRIAAEMVKEKLIRPEEAVLRVEPEHMEQALHPMFDPAERRLAKCIGAGLAASPGAAAGRVVFEPDRAVEWKNRDERVVLVRHETSPDDIHGMKASEGVLTATGGMTSHAAVVGRQMGKPSVVGCSLLEVNEKQGVARLGGHTLREGDFLSLDGTQGEVLMGDVPRKPSEILAVMRGELAEAESPLYQQFTQVLKWADRIRHLGVRANADTPEQGRLSMQFGAEGIGLCRTEHMFLGERLPLVQKMILAETPEAKEEALKSLLPMQQDDFYQLFLAMKGTPVTIRTLDPPLHEFLPNHEELLLEVERLRGDEGDEAQARRALLRRVEQLREFNPMMGHRGCRLGITTPELTEMQARAIFEAACQVVRDGKKVQPEVMIPLVSVDTELEHQRAIVERVARETIARHGVRLKYLIGTMIEIPRACVTADEVARVAEFFSFGTNDLTQMGFGFSRDDAGSFLPGYVDTGILRHDPFAALDQGGIGRLVEMGVRQGRATRPELKVGVCGEHGGDPSSVKFFHRVGLDYVSCSPYRIPVARMAAAHAVLEERGTAPRVKPYRRRGK